MFQKCSILDRPVRPQSAKNVESAPKEYAASLVRDAAKHAEYQKWAVGSGSG